MVSIITVKLRRQMLDDKADDFDPLLQLEERVTPLQEMVTGSVSDSSKEFTASSSHESGPIILCNRCSKSNLLRRRRETDDDARCHGNASCDDDDDRCQFCCPLLTKKRHSHVMLSPDDTSDVILWRPDWQATSIWRPVGLGNPLPQGLPTATEIAVAMPTGDAAFCSNECVDRTSRRRLSTSSESPSPVQRPASASSGFLENYGGSTHHMAGRWAMGSKQCPSLNLSAFSLTSSGLSPNDVTSVRRVVVPASTGSMPAIGDNDSSCSGWLGLGQPPPRCHSQPSILFERRGVKKRRREEKRPNLNFIKMKETAYSKRHQGAHSRPRNHVQFVDNSNFLQVAKSEGGGDDQSRFFYSLDTIASSPQELGFCEASVSPMGGTSTPLHSATDSDVGESGAYRESLDSGCSGDFVPCFDSSESDLESRKKQLKTGIEEEEEEVFDLDLLDDLDIEEIEKD